MGQPGGGRTLRGHDLGAQLRDDALQAGHVAALAARVDVHLEHLYEALSLQLPPHQAQDLQILDGEQTVTIPAGNLTNVQTPSPHVLKRGSPQLQRLHLQIGTVR